MKRILWMAAALFGVVAGVALSLLIAHQPPGSLVRLLQADPGIFFLLILLGAECAMLANDIAACKGWKGFNETRMYPGADTPPTGPPLSLRAKLFFVYPFFIGFFVLMLTLIVARAHDP
jgi:hypothetical protein